MSPASLFLIVTVTQEPGYDLRKRTAALQGIWRVSFQTLSHLEVISLCPAKWKNLNYRIYLLSVLLCHFFTVSRSLSRFQGSSFVFDSYFQRFYEDLPVHFFYTFPYFTRVKYCLWLSVFSLSSKERPFFNLFYFFPQIFPFGFREFFIFVIGEIRVRLLELR